MIKLLILVLSLQVELGAHKAFTVPENLACENKPDLHYYVDIGIICAPTDLIFQNGFNGVTGLLTKPDDEK